MGRERNCRKLHRNAQYLAIGKGPLERRNYETKKGLEPEMQGLYRRRPPSPFLLTRAGRLREWSPGSPHVRGSGFWNPGNLCSWNPESWALKSGAQFKKFGIPLTIGIQNPGSTDKV